MVRKAFANIETAKLKVLLGMENSDEMVFTKYLTDRGMTINGQYVDPGHDQNNEKRTFEISESRIE